MHGLLPLKLFSTRYEICNELKFDNSKWSPPKNAFELNLRIQTNVKTAPIHTGISPESLFLFKWSDWSHSNRPKDFGIVPNKLFFPRIRKYRSVQLFIDEGMLHVRLFLEKSRIWRCRICPIDFGMIPIIWLPERENTNKFGMDSPILARIEPENLLLDGSSE